MRNIPTPAAPFSSATSTSCLQVDVGHQGDLRPVPCHRGKIAARAQIALPPVLPAKLGLEIAQPLPLREDVHAAFVAVYDEGIT